MNQKPKPHLNLTTANFLNRIISVCKKTVYFQVFDKKTSKTRLSKFLKSRSLLIVNDCFKNESNAVFGVFLQRLIISAILTFLVTLYPKTTLTQVLEQDSLALVVFYNSTGGPDWTNNYGWLTGPVSTWYGVTVEGDRVIELGGNGTFSFNNLTGHLPSEIGELTALRKLVPGNNPELSGEIPVEIGNLQQLAVIGIGNCSLTGTIPNTIGNCSCLKSISFRENNLTGSIPGEIGNLDSLKFLHLYDNQLTGLIPSELGNLTILRTLELYQNNLSGTIPENLGNCDSLGEFRINNNQLTGELPEELAFFTNISQFDVSYNQLEGDMPDVFGQNNFSGNMLLNDNKLTGIPPWSGGHWILEALTIENNKMTFEDIEPHFVGYTYFTYAPQDSMEMKTDTLLPPGSNISIYSGTGGEYTYYKWFLNDELILESSTADTLYIENLTASDTGTYTCTATNSKATELTLYRRPYHIGLDTGAYVKEKNIQAAIKVFPNPVTDALYIKYSHTQNTVSIAIYSLYGKPVFKKVINSHNGKTKINMQGFKAGVYILNIENETNSFNHKLIKQ